MQFALVIVGSHSVEASVDGSAAASEFADFEQAVLAAGVKLHGAPFNAVPTGRDVRHRDGRLVVTEIEGGDEYLGGYLVIEAADLDEALEWAGRCPGAKYGRVEVRPLVMM